MCTAVNIPEVATMLPSGLALELFAKTSASVLAESLMKLHTAERLILSLRYFHELPLRDVASVMKLEGHVAAELHARAIKALSRIVRPGQDLHLNGDIPDEPAA